jgi:hypothetical protein
MQVSSLPGNASMLRSCMTRHSLVVAAKSLVRLTKRGDILYCPSDVEGDGYLDGL